MCTLIALHRCVSGAPLVVAANRDEYLDRPAQPPAVRRTPAGPVLAPLDLQAGGTWLGVNRWGVVAAVTNRPARPLDPQRRSRGLLVLDALAGRSAREVAEPLSGLPANGYNPFNLFVADAEHAFVLTYDEKARLSRLAPGVHVIGNAEPDDDRTPKLARLRSRAEALARGPASAVLDRLAELCRRHEAGAGPLESVCIHTVGYGTRSSTLLRLGPDGGELRHAEGAPCATEYEDLTDLLSELGRAAEVGSGDQAVRGRS